MIYVVSVNLFLIWCANRKKNLRFTESLNKTNFSKVGENTGLSGYFYLKTILPF